MKKRDSFEILTIQTNNAALIWKNVYGIAPDAVAEKLDKAMLKWQSELTKTLKIWIDKGLNMSEGELILARANLGAVVEAWLRFFYCVFYDNYEQNPITKKSGQVLSPEKELRFEDLKNYSTGILWDSQTSDDYIWVDSVQHKRNAIHSFQYREIGTSMDFQMDIIKLYDFVDRLLMKLPPIEDYIESYPPGYVLNVYYTDEED